MPAKTKDEEAILALAHALADMRWIAEDREREGEMMQGEIDNMKAQNGELQDKILRIELTLAQKAAEITRLNEDCARRARDLTTFDQMRAQAIRERDEARASYAQAFADLQAAHDASDKIIAEKDAEISQQAAQIKELSEERARLLDELDVLHHPERP